MPIVIILRPSIEIKVTVGQCQVVPSKIGVCLAVHNSWSAFHTHHSGAAQGSPPPTGVENFIVCSQSIQTWSSCGPRTAQRWEVHWTHQDSHPGVSGGCQGAPGTPSGCRRKALLATVAGVIIMFNPDITWSTSAVPAGVFAKRVTRKDAHRWGSLPNTSGSRLLT